MFPGRSAPEAAHPATQCFPSVSPLLFPAACPRVVGTPGQGPPLLWGWTRRRVEMRVVSPAPSHLARILAARPSKEVPSRLGRVFLTPALPPRPPAPPCPTVPGLPPLTLAELGHGISALRLPAPASVRHRARTPREPLCLFHRLPLLFRLQPRNHHLFRAQTNPRPFLLPHTWTSASEAEKPRKGLFCSPLGSNKAWGRQ